MGSIPNGFHGPAVAGEPEPIAIIGAACRFSGMATNQDNLWQVLTKGMTTWSKNARNRFKLESFWHPHAQHIGSFNCQGLHLLNQDPAVFDNDFFGISGVEAKAIDPQQRLLLEVAYETFENAGVPLGQLEGSNTGVYCAVSYFDYDGIQGRDPEVSATYRFTGTGPSMIANRISYVFDLRGPSITIDTACSSTLVALHEACRALRAGDTNQVLVGGTSLILDPDKLTVISSMQFLSPHGRCYSFDSRANGYGRGEGVAAILLKPLSAAIRDGDAIRGVIRGTAIGSDGKTPGITMPSPAAQFDTITRAYEAAGLDPGDTLYVEAHGTGTTAGDKCEAEAFARTFCARRKIPEKLLVGSVKANLGHTECVSGLAALIKAILVLEKGVIVPNPNFVSPNPKFEMESYGMQVPTKITEWPQGVVRRASVNNSGYGGMNAHVIIDAGPDINSPAPIIDSLKHANGDSVKTGPSPKLFVWTHMREHELGKMAAVWKRFLMAEGDTLSLNSLAYTLGSRRSIFSYRAAVVASGLEELIEGLTKLETGAVRPVKAAPSPKICYVFTGQGAQWARMGRELLSVYPVFAQSMRRAEDDLLRLGATWKLLEELDKPADVSRLNDAELAQPCTTAIQIALVDLLESFGVKPDQVCGHSSGEIGAAYALGALSAFDAVKVAFFRGVTVRELKASCPELKGAMMAVGLSEPEARKRIESSGYRGAITVACINSATSVTLSGDVNAIDELSRILEEAKIFNRKLAVGVAYHSHHMACAKVFYHVAVRDIRPRSARPGVRMVSSVTGKPIQGEDLNASYWTANLLSPVRFSEALGGSLHLLASERAAGAPASSSLGLIVEVGPHATLRGPILQTAKEAVSMYPFHYASCLTRHQDATATLLACAAELFTRGVPVDLNQANKLLPGVDGVKVLTSLPSYNWYHENAYWNESRRSAAYRFRKFPRHDLLGSLAPDSISAEPSWHNYLRLSETPWLSGHSVGGSALFGAPSYVAMVVEALRQQLALAGRGWRRHTVSLRQITFGRPLLVEGDNGGVGIEVFLQLRPCAYSARESSSVWQEFRVFSVSPESESTEHCRGLAAVLDSRVEEDVAGKILEASDAKDTDEPWVRLDVPKLYMELQDVGIEYSGPYICLDSVKARPWESRCEAVVPDVKAAMPSNYQQPHCIHPVTLDGCFQAIFPGLKLGDALDESQVVTSIDELRLSTDINLKPGEKLSIETKSSLYGLKQHRAEFTASKAGTGGGAPLVVAKGIKFSILGQRGSQGSEQEGEGEPLCYRIDWELDPFTSPKEVVSSHCRKDLVNRNQQLRKRCDPFCRSLIRETIKNLTPEDEAAVSGLLKYYLQWVREQQDETGEDILPMTPEFEAEAMALGAQGEALVRIGQRIREIFRGEVDTLSVLLEGGLLYRLYFEDDCLNRCHAQLAEYLRLARFKVPSLKVLEIGGGTGSLTFTLLEALYSSDDDESNGNAAKYVFTDVSTGFLAHTRERIGRFEPHVDFARFDIEQPAAEQGFEPGSFDVIVASNVVHATQSIRRTLANLRTLLRPGGGRLAIVETTRPSLRWGTMFGGLPGWWAGAGEGRDRSPFQDAGGWDAALLDAGFAGVTMEMKDYESEEEHEVSLIVSETAKAVEEVAADEVQEGVTIITAGAEDAVASKVSDLIKAHSPETSVSIVPISEAQEPRGTVIVLLETNQDFLMDPAEDSWMKIRDTVCNAHTVLWVSKGGQVECSEPRQALVSGLGRSLRSEHHDVRFFTLDVDPAAPSDDQVASDILQVYERVLGPAGSTYSAWEWELAARDGGLLIPRVAPDKSANTWVEDSVSKYHPREEKNVDLGGRSLELCIRSPGSLDTLYWKDRQGSASPGPLKPGQVSVKLDYAALNFRDLMTATGQLEGCSKLLVEGSGTVVEVSEEAKERFSVGDAVCVLDLDDGLATVTTIDQSRAYAIPEGMSLEAAAAIPVAYATALFSLRDTAHLRAGESVLIHSAAGAVGQAAVAVAKFLGAGDIFVTINESSNPEKRELLRTKFGLPDDHILPSNNDTAGATAISDAVLAATGGAGVDVVLSSLAGEAAMAASCRVLAPFGRLVDVGKRDVAADARLRTAALSCNNAFATVDLALLARAKPAALRELVETALGLVKEGTVGMIEPVAAVHASQAGEQLGVMQAGKHVGKIVLRLDNSMPLKVQPQQPQPPRLDSDGSYLVVGGTGGLGRAIVRYLAKLGARRIITLSRSGGEAASTAVADLVEEMKARGVDLAIVKGDVCDKSTMELVKTAAGDKPVKGIINGVMDLHDSTIKSMTQEQWRKGISAKVAGTLNLNAAFNDASSSSLDFFILLGSTGAVTGNISQGNYVAGNAFQDAFARHFAAAQKGKGARVVAVDVGLVRGEGFTAENEAARAFISSLGHRPHSLGELLAVLGYAIAQKRSDTGSEDKDEEGGAAAARSSADKAQILLGARRADPRSGTDEAARQRPDARFSHIWSSPGSSAQGGSAAAAADGDKAGGGEADAQAALRAASSPSAAVEAAYAGLRRKVAQLLDIPPREIQPDRSVVSYGVDSLIELQLRNWVAARLGARVTMLELMSSMSVVQLAEVVARRSRLVPAGVFEAADAP